VPSIQTTSSLSAKVGGPEKKLKTYFDLASVFINRYKHLKEEENSSSLSSIHLVETLLHFLRCVRSVRNFNKLGSYADHNNPYMFFTFCLSISGTIRLTVNLHW
jgi:hypothetical protein